MDDAKIKEEFEKGKSDPRNTVSANYQALIAHYDAVDKAAAIGFYMKCNTDERLAKIEVLEEVSYMIDEFTFADDNCHENAKLRITNMINELKDGQ